MYVPSSFLYASSAFSYLPYHSFVRILRPLVLILPHFCTHPFPFCTFLLLFCAFSLQDFAFLSSPFCTVLPVILLLSLRYRSFLYGTSWFLRFFATVLYRTSLLFPSVKPAKQGLFSSTPFCTEVPKSPRFCAFFSHTVFPITPCSFEERPFLRKSSFFRPPAFPHSPSCVRVATVSPQHRNALGCSFQTILYPFLYGSFSVFVHLFLFFVRFLILFCTPVLMQKYPCFVQFLLLSCSLLSTDLFGSCYRFVQKKS